MGKHTALSSEGSWSGVGEREYETNGFLKVLTFLINLSTSVFTYGSAMQMS